jgi:pimeloyl-ACP methyl ester carboxylesterase
VSPPDDHASAATARAFDLQRARARARDWVLDYGYGTSHKIADFLARPSWAHLRDGPLAPVLLIPGVFEKWQFLKPVGERLHDGGHPVFVVEALGHNSYTIPQSAAIAAAVIKAAGLHDVIVVGHSKGGLIGKHVMLFNDPLNRVDRIVTFATPFSGTRNAKIAISPALRAFSPTEATLAMLARRTDVNSRITSIYPTVDWIVPEGSYLEGATNIEIPMFGHFRPLGSDLLADTIAREVDRKPTAQP